MNTLRHRVESAIANRVDGGLVRVYVAERKLKQFTALFAFAAMLFVPVIVLALFV